MKENEGFTLIEALMIVFILGIVVVMGGSLFFSILKGASKGELTKEVKQNGDYAMAVMERMVRSAQAVVPNSDGQTCVSSMNKLKIKNLDGGEIEFGCLAQDGVTRIASGSSSLTGNNVTLGASCPGSLSFACASGNEYSPAKVTISFTLYQKGSSTRPEEQARAFFQKTISLRTY